MGYVRTGKQPPLGSGAEQIYPPTASRQIPIETAEDRKTVQIFTGGSSIETLGGLAAAVLAVIGITGHYALTMLGIACIATGLALLAHGSSIAARWRHVLVRLEGDQYDRSELIGGIGTEVFGGAVGLVLGIMALANIMPYVLLPVAAIVFGGSLLLGGAAQPELEELVPEYNPRYRRITRDAIQASGGVMVMVGIASAVLGILALLAVGPILTLSLVAMLCVGAALLLAGGALTARFAHRFV